MRYDLKLNVSSMKTLTLHVTGMHCSACPILIESELTDLPEVSTAKASLAQNTVEVSGEFGEKTPTNIAADLTEVIKKHGYTVSVDKQKSVIRWTDFNIAIPAAAGFIALFILLQKLGIVNLVTTSHVTYGTAFVIGLIASVSTCMAVVGGLVLSMSASFAKEGDAYRPQVLFHVGRLLSFFVLGGVIGAIGSAFQLNSTGVFALSLLVGVVLLILGLSLLDIFPWAKRLQPTLPKFLGDNVQGLKKVNHTLTPFVVGAATFILPCGFTQSMQLYALTTGSFWMGALTMSAFALGTLPVLSLLSFSSVGINKFARSGVFFKTAGLVVIFFGIFNIINSLVAAGIIAPLFSF